MRCASQFSSRLIAVNSYDDTLRVYDAALQQPFATTDGPGPRSTPHHDEARVLHTARQVGVRHGLECIHRLAGHRNRHWPIKSSIFVGHDYVRRASLIETSSGLDMMYPMHNG